MAIETSQSEFKPRICMPTARRFTRRAFQCGLYEAQDVLAQNDAVDLIEFETKRGFLTRQAWQRRLLYYDVSKRLIYVNPGLKRVRLTRQYDLLVVVCPNYWDLLYVNAIEGWKDHCKTSVCWVDEMWPAEIPLFKYWLHWLRQFDYVFVGLRGSVAPLSKAIGRDCRWLPGAVDCMRFTPHPTPPARVVDVYSIGRRWDGIHQELLDAAARKEVFYVYDTFAAADSEPFDHRQHRDMLANMTKRSRFFMVAPPKMDVPEETQGQSGIGYRYYEGAAAGAVMIGQAPTCPEFAEMFPWPEAVISIRPDGSDVLRVLSRFSAEPERVVAIGERNAGEALTRHDWAHRWNAMFRVIGMEPSAGMLAREERLKELADPLMQSCKCR
jgi:spore maturation protein CgeB